MTQEFVVSGDSHVVEPMDLFTERLPKNLRDKALTQTEFELDEPLTPGGHTVFRTVHAPGYEGWTVSRYRQNTGPTPDWEPSGILRDMDRDGVDATVLFSNFALFATYTDDHEVAKFDYSSWVGRRIGRDREDAGLAGLVERVELNRMRRKLSELSPPDVGHIREAAPSEEGLKRHSPAGVPVASGQYLVLEPLEALSDGFPGDVLR